MGVGVIGNITTTGTVGSYKQDIITKLKNGQNEASFQLGSKSYTQTEWEKELSKFDDAEEELVKATEQAAKEKQALTNAKSATEKLQEAYQVSKKGLGVTDTVNIKEKYDSKMLTHCPYASRAKEGSIEYNGVIFDCDYENNAITLGDVSNKSNNVYISLSGGGSLIVSKENLGDLQNAISMFSPEDQGIILKTIAAEKMTVSKQAEFDEEEEDTLEKVEGDSEE